MDKSFPDAAVSSPGLGCTADAFPPLPAASKQVGVDSQQLHGCVRMLEQLGHMLVEVQNELAMMCANAHTGVTESSPKLQSAGSTQGWEWPRSPKLPKLAFPLTPVNVANGGMDLTTDRSYLSARGSSSSMDFPLGSGWNMKGPACFAFLSAPQDRVDDNNIEEMVTDQVILQVTNTEQRRLDEKIALQEARQAAFSSPPAKATLKALVRKNPKAKRSKPAKPVARSWLTCFKNVKSLHPDSTFQLVWSLVSFAFILFCFLYLPAVVAFEMKPEGALFIVVSIVDAFFIADVPRAMFTGFMEGDELVLSPTRTFCAYARSWMIPDVLAAIPWEWISIPPSSRLRLTKALRCLRMLRLSRLVGLVKLGKTMQKFAVYIESKPLLIFAIGVARVLALLFGITHWGACVWYYVGAHSSEDGSWLDKFLPDNTSMMRSYVYSVYFILTTMTTVGYGDMSAQNYDEVSFVLVLLFVASIVFAGLMGTLNDLIASLNTESRALEERKFTLSRYMQWRAVPRDLYLVIRQHLVFKWTSECIYENFEEEIKEALPPALRLELCHHIHGHVLRTMPFLAWLRRYDICLKQLTNKVESRFMSFGDDIFLIGQESTEIYILRTGTVRISQNANLFSEGPVGYALHHSPDKSASDFPKSDLPFNTGIESRLLWEAMAILDGQDEEEMNAARFVQRRWRFKKYLKKRRTSVEEVQPRLLPRNHIPTSTVNAPAYFGEACLWVPRADWDTGPPMKHTYNARCESRCEILDLNRTAVQEVLVRFSPWLGERFDSFQQAVLRGMGSGMRRAPGNTCVEPTPNLLEKVNESSSNNVVQSPVATPRSIRSIPEVTHGRDATANVAQHTAQYDASLSNSLQEPLLGSAGG